MGAWSNARLRALRALSGGPFAAVVLALGHFRPLYMASPSRLSSLDEELCIDYELHGLYIDLPDVLATEPSGNRIF